MPAHLKPRRLSRLRRWLADFGSLAESRDRAVRAEQECTRLRGLYERAVDDAARLRLTVKGQADAIAGLEALVADLDATLTALGVADLPEVEA